MTFQESLLNICSIQTKETIANCDENHVSNHSIEFYFSPLIYFNNLFTTLVQIAISKENVYMRLF